MQAASILASGGPGLRDRLRVALAWGILSQSPDAIPGALLFVFVCLLAVPFAPFALAPLAASWNRHR